MVQIEINNEYLELPNELKLSLKQRNELLYEETLPLTYSLPFKLFLTPKNCEILNYPQEWKNKALFTGEMECLVYLFENDNPRKSLLNFKSCSDTEVECYIQVGKDLGNITELSLNEIDMGTMQIVQDDDNPFFDERRIGGSFGETVPGQFINPEIYINGVKFSLYCMHEVGETLEEKTTRMALEFKNLVDNSNIGVIVDNFEIAPYSADPLPSGFGIAFILKSTVSHQYINVVKQQFSISTPYIVGSEQKFWSWFLEADILVRWDLIRNDSVYVIGKIKELHQSYINNNVEYPCLFPIVNNTRFVGEDSTNFNLFQNFNLEDTTFSDDLLAFATPMPFLVYIIKKTFKFLGFDAVGDFFENDAIKRLILYSNVAADQWFCDYGLGNYIINDDGYNVTYPNSRNVNFHSNLIKISKYAPNMSIKDFLIAVRTSFNLKFTYDYKNMTVNVEFVKDLQSFKIHQAPNLTEYFVNSWSMQFQKAQDKNVSIKSFEFDIDSNDNQNSFLLPYQQKLIIDKNGKKEIKPKIGTIGEEVIESCMMPSVKIDGVYNGGGETISQLKMLQVFGFRTDRNPAENNIKDQLYAMSQDRYAFFTRVSPLTISWQGDKGFYNQFWKNFTKLLVENKTLKIKTTFPPEQLSRMEENPFVFVNDSLLLFKEQDSEINANGTSTQNGTYVIV